MSARVSSHLALFIKQVKDSQLGFNQVNTWLVVIEVDERPLDLFFYILILFQFENMLEILHIKENISFIQ